MDLTTLLTRVMHGSIMQQTVMSLVEPEMPMLTATGSRSMLPDLPHIGGSGLRALGTVIVSVALVLVAVSTTVLPAIASEWPRLALWRKPRILHLSSAPSGAFDL